MRLRLATRSSELALWQARRVADIVRLADPSCEVELVTVTTSGDRRTDVPVWEMGGRGVFVAEVQVAVLDGRADAAVHSAKDLQPVTSPGLVLAAVPERADRRDVLVGSRLSDLRPGAIVATGSQRRRAQLAALRPDLQFQSLRGNIATRLGRAPAGGAIVVAMAALQRLGLHPEPAEVLAEDVMLPQVAQGAIAVECREDDETVVALLGSLDDPAARTTVTAERSFLATIGGACDLPVAGAATATAGGVLTMTGLLASPDGTSVVRRSASGAAGAPADLGREVALAVLESGGRQMLDQLRSGTR